MDMEVAKGAVIGLGAFYVVLLLIYLFAPYKPPGGW